MDGVAVRHFMMETKVGSVGGASKLDPMTLA